MLFLLVDLILWNHFTGYQIKSRRSCILDTQWDVLKNIQPLVSEKEQPLMFLSRGIFLKLGLVKSCLQLNFVFFLKKQCLPWKLPLCCCLTRITNFCMSPFSSNFDFSHCEFLLTSSQNCKNCPFSTSQCNVEYLGKSPLSRSVRKIQIVQTFLHIFFSYSMIINQWCSLKRSSARRLES